MNDINDLAPKIFIDIIIKTLYTLYMMRNEREIEMSKEITANEMLMDLFGTNEVTFDGPYRKVGVRKDEFGNEIKYVAKYLAKKAMKEVK